MSYGNGNGIGPEPVPGRGLPGQGEDLAVTHTSASGHQCPAPVRPSKLRAGGLAGGPLSGEGRWVCWACTGRFVYDPTLCHRALEVSTAAFWKL